MRTRICDQLGIDVPIVGFTPSPEVAVAISRAGGLGVLGAVRYVADAEARIRRHQSRELLGVPVVQIVGQMNEVRPVAEVIDRLLREFAEASARVVRTTAAIS